MPVFKNITISKNANIYFDGQVSSRSIFLADGTRKSLGVMLPGEYEFRTDSKELMEILSGDLEISLPGEEGWRTVREGESFEVPAQSNFRLRIRKTTDYCCSYLD